MTAPVVSDAAIDRRAIERFEAVIRPRVRTTPVVEIDARELGLDGLRIVGRQLMTDG